MSFVQWTPGTQNAAPTTGQPAPLASSPSQTTVQTDPSLDDRTCKECGRCFTRCAQGVFAVRPLYTRLVVARAAIRTGPAVGFPQSRTPLTSLLRPSALCTHMNTHTGARPFECRAPGCAAAFAARSNMLRHRRTHGENVVAVLEEQERREAAARPPPPAVFSTTIVSEEIGGGGNGDAPVNVQWMTPNRASRAYRRYPDVIPQVEANVVAPVAPGTSSSAPVYWQGAGPQQDGQNGHESSYRWA